MTTMSDPQPTPLSTLEDMHMDMDLAEQEHEQGPHLLHSQHDHDGELDDNESTFSAATSNANDPCLLSFSEKTDLLFGTPQPVSQTLLPPGVSLSHLTVSQKSDFFKHKLSLTPQRAGGLLAPQRVGGLLTPQRTGAGVDTGSRTPLRHQTMNTDPAGRRGWSSTPRRTKAAPRVALTARSPKGRNGIMPMSVPRPLQTRSVNNMHKNQNQCLTPKRENMNGKQPQSSLKSSTPAREDASNREDKAVSFAEESRASKDTEKNAAARSRDGSIKEEGSSRRLMMPRRHSFTSTRNIIVVEELVSPAKEEAHSPASAGGNRRTQLTLDTQDTTIHRVNSSPTSEVETKRHKHFRDTYAVLNESNISPHKLSCIIMDNPVTKAAFLAQQTPEYRKKTKMYGTPQFAGRLGMDRFPNPPTYYVRTWTTGAELCSPTAFTSANKYIRKSKKYRHSTGGLPLPSAKDLGKDVQDGEDQEKQQPELSPARSVDRHHDNKSKNNVDVSLINVAMFTPLNSMEDHDDMMTPQSGVSASQADASMVVQLGRSLIKERLRNEEEALGLECDANACSPTILDLDLNVDAKISKNQAGPDTGDQAAKTDTDTVEDTNVIQADAGDDKGEGEESTKIASTSHGRGHTSPAPSIVCIGSTLFDDSSPDHSKAAANSVASYTSNQTATLSDMQEAFGNESSSSLEMDMDGMIVIKNVETIDDGDLADLFQMAASTTGSSRMGDDSDDSSSCEADDERELNERGSDDEEEDECLLGETPRKEGGAYASTASCGSSSSSSSSCSSSFGGGSPCLSASSSSKKKLLLDDEADTNERKCVATIPEDEEVTVMEEDETEAEADDTVPLSLRSKHDVHDDGMSLAETVFASNITKPAVPQATRSPVRLSRPTPTAPPQPQAEKVDTGCACIIL